MRTIKIGVLGLGTVGSGMLNILNKSIDTITQRTGVKLVVSHASARDITKPRNCDLTGIQLSVNPIAVVEDPEVDILVELIGGEDPALDLVMRAIELGKHVVTANKALLAHHGNEIFAAARKKNVSVGFEAAVAGGIPIIKALREGLAGNQIDWLTGIINGTSNYILTEMSQHGTPFDDVLKVAQELGYAEADPTFDIEGIDAAHKLCLLAAIAFGIPLEMEHIYTEGISAVTPEDLNYANELGYQVKHLGIARCQNGDVELRVHPTLVPNRQLIANVHGVMNAVMVHGDAVGQTLYYGPGAGSLPTASAVVADIIDLSRQLVGENACQVPALGFRQEAVAARKVVDISDARTAFYLRMEVEDTPGVMAGISRVLADLDISIEAILQKEPKHGERHVPLILLTQVTQESRLNKALTKIKELGFLRSEAARIRVEHFDD